MSEVMLVYTLVSKQALFSVTKPRAPVGPLVWYEKDGEDVPVLSMYIYLPNELRL